MFIVNNGFEIFLATHLEVKFDFETYSNKQNLDHKVLQKQHTNTLVKENIIQMTCYVCKMVFKCQKIAKQAAKNTSKTKHPTKMLLIHS